MYSPASRPLSAAALVVAVALGIGMVQATPALAAPKSPVAHHAPKYRSIIEKAAAAHKPVVYKAGNYIVRLRAQPAATYTGGARGFRATHPSTGHQLNAHRDAVRAYTKHLTSAQESIAASHGITTTYNYTLAFNGFAAKLTAAQATALAHDPQVVSITRNTLLKVQAATPVSDLSSLNFLKISSMGGLWDTIGGPDNAGKGIVVGDLDTGIAPENPSFAGDPLGTTAGAAPYLNGNTVTFTKADGNTFTSTRVAAGNGWTNADYSTKIIGAKYYVDGFGVDNLGGPAVGDGARDEYVSPRDGAGHGSHTASTAAGDYGVDASVLVPDGSPIDLGGISGVAPAAKIAMYKVCWDGKAADETLDGCATSDIVAGIDQAVADGVDVLNFSIGGDSAITTDSPTDEAFKAASAAGIFVAAAGGNAGPDESTLDNASPWETTVAASTIPAHEATVLFDNGDSLVGASITVNSDPATQLTDKSVVRGRDIPGLGQAASKAAQCAPGTLSHALAAGKVVVCERQGNFARADTSAEVKSAGGVGEILVNTSADLDDVDIDPHSVPTVHLSSDYLDVVNDDVASGAKVSFAPGNVDGVSAAAPQVADFSSRGPVLAGGSDILKPDVAAPGVDILAAVANAPGASGKWEFYSGTSMATPHVTGLAALYLGVHPLAAPMDIKSALMTTSTRTVGEFGEPVTDPFTQGAGEVNPSRYLNPGLVYSSTLADWNAYLVGTGQVDPDDPQYAGVTAIDPSNLNTPSISIGGFFVKQTVKRSVTSTAAGTWKGSASVPGFTVKVVPSTLKFTAAGQTKSFTVSFVRSTAHLDEWKTGTLNWRNGSASAHSPIALLPASLAGPQSVKGTGVDGSVTVPIDSGRKQDVFFGALGLAKGEITNAQGPVGAQFTDTATTGDHAIYQHTVAPADVIDEFGDEAGTEFLRFAVSPVGAAAGTNLDLYVYYYAKASDVPATPTKDNLASHEVAEAVSPAASESIDYFTPSFDAFNNGGVYVTYVDVVSAPAGTKYAEKVFNLRDDASDGDLTPNLFSDGGSDYLGRPGVTRQTKYSWEGLDPYSDYVAMAITQSDSTGFVTLLNVSTQKPRNVTPPSITQGGDSVFYAVIGSTLTADPGTWDSAVSSLALDYQWLKDGTPIVGATNPTYVVANSDFGHSIRVRVTAQFGTAGGTTTVTSPSPVAIRAAIKTATITAPTKVKVGKSFQFTYTVTLDPATYPGAAPSLAGDVFVTYGSKKLTAHLSAAGTVTVTLPKSTKKGTVGFSVGYGGTDLVMAANPTTSKFTVV